MANEQTPFTVLTCSPNTLVCYENQDSRLLLDEKPKYRKSQRNLAYLATKAFISTQVTVSKEVDEADLYDIIENSAYDELGLDITLDYKIAYFEREPKEDKASRLFEVFIVEPELLTQTFGPLIEKIRYIHELIPQPLLIRTLYQKELLQSDKTDLFVYFNDNDAFLALYKEGEFLYAKDLEFSLEALYELYCQICGDRIEYDDFLELFTQTGLRTTDEQKQPYLIKLITEILSHINEILNFAKRTFNLDAIHRVLIGTSHGPIHGIDEFSQTILGIESQNFDFDYGFEQGSGYVDQLHQLLQLTATIPLEERYNCNLTTFPPPPELLHRTSGRLIAIVAASLVISLALPAYNIIYTTFASLTMGSLKDEQKSVHAQKVEREQAINQLLAKRKELQEKKSVALDIQRSQKDILTKIYIKKVQYPMKAKIITDLTQDLNTYNVQLMKIEYTNSPLSEKHTFLLKMTAAKEKNITTMIEKLTRDNLQDYTITMQLLNFNEEIGLYLCDLKVELKSNVANLETKAGS